MADLTYLSLTNDVLANLNETPLTAANFSAATGFHNLAKIAVNNAIDDIHSKEFEWPFAHATASVTLTEGEQFYYLPIDNKTVDWDSFYIAKDTTADPEISAKKLVKMSYDAWLESRMELDRNMTTFSKPDFVFKGQDGRFGVSNPPTDAGYTVKYEYWFQPTALETHDDEASVPIQYRRVIVDGAMYYAYMFRDNIESASKAEGRFMDGIGRMRTQLINSYDTVRAPDYVGTTSKDWLNAG